MPQVKISYSASGKYESDYPFSFSTSSVIPYMYDPDKQVYSVVCIRRKNDPHKGRLAFAGGFQNPGKESLEATAVRELEEETHIKKTVGELKLICVQSDPTRDPRGTIIDHVYAAKITPKDLLGAHADDDAGSLELVEITNDTLYGAACDSYKQSKLEQMFAFDHGRSLIEFYRQR